MNFHYFLLVIFSASLTLASNNGKPVSSGSAKASPGLIELDRTAVYLYRQSQHFHHAAKATYPLHPHRIYIKYDEDLHRWIYVLSELDGQLPSPTEALRPETVASGSVVGAKLALQRFRLTEDGSWVPTAKPEIYRIWRQGSPPLLLDVTFSKRKPATHRGTQRKGIRSPKNQNQKK